MYQASLAKRNDVKHCDSLLNITNLKAYNENIKYKPCSLLESLLYWEEALFVSRSLKLSFSSVLGIK